MDGFKQLADDVLSEEYGPNAANVPAWVRQAHLVRAEVEELIKKRWIEAIGETANA